MEKPPEYGGKLRIGRDFCRKREGFGGLMRAGGLGIWTREGDDSMQGGQSAGPFARTVPCLPPFPASAGRPSPCGGSFASPGRIWYSDSIQVFRKDLRVKVRLFPGKLLLPFAAFLLLAVSDLSSSSSSRAEDGFWFAHSQSSLEQLWSGVMGCADVASPPPPQSIYS